MTYHCCDCGRTFDEPAALWERENLDGERGVELRFIAVCPYCYGEDIETTNNEEETP